MVGQKLEELLQCFASCGSAVRRVNSNKELWVTLDPLGQGFSACARMYCVLGNSKQGKFG
jgi:hypothetical protein